MNPIIGPIVGTLNIIIYALILSIFAVVIISWLRVFGMRISPYHPVVRVIEQMADLILAPIRRAIPAAGGGIDFSPMIAIIILYIVRAIIANIARHA